MRISRRLRSTIAAAVTTGALLALPSAALAEPTWTTSSLTSAGPYVSGATATYTLEIRNSGTAVEPTGGTVTLEEDGEPVVVSTVTKAACATGTDRSAKVTVADGTPAVTIAADFDDGCAKVTFVVHLPARHDSDWQVIATGTPGGEPFFEEDMSRTVSKGGPSTIKLAFPDDAPRWVAKDGTWTSTLTATNKGAGAAEFTRVVLAVPGNASVFSPDWGANPPFNPTGTFTAGCASVDAMGCHLGTIPAGESRSVTVSAGTLTHFGSIDVYATAHTADRESWWHHDASRNVQVTNGRSALVMTDVEGPQAAAGGTDLTYTGEFVNDGPDALDAAQLDVSASAFNTEGKSFWSAGGTEVESIRSITLSNGATCAPEVNNHATPAVARMNDWDCPLANIAPGQRVTFTVVANFPTAEKDANAWISATIQTPTYIVEGGDPSDSAGTALNVEKTVDLEVAASSQALIGTGHVAPVTVTVTNHGNTKAERVSLAGTVRGVAGTFDTASLPSKCAGVSKPQFTRCALGAIEPGATASLVIDVKAGADLGGLAIQLSASQNGPGMEVNDDNDAVTHVMTVARSSSVPLNAVVFRPKAVNANVLLRGRGLNTRVKCPTTCKATVQLWVKRPVAMKMKLRMPRKGDVLVGTSTKVSNPAGNVTVFTKVTKRHQAAFRAYRRPVMIQRKTTAVSTAASNLGASTVTTQNLVVKPAPMRRPRR